jgi:hypothetical protein
MMRRLILRARHGSLRLRDTRPATHVLVCYFLSSETLLLGERDGITDYHIESDYSLNRRGEGSVDAVVDYSWLDTRGDDFLASTHYKEGQDHQGENAVHQRTNPMMDMWSSYELFISETINSPSTTRSILASGIEYVFA